MKINELQIGDWVRYLGKPYRIAEIAACCCIDAEHCLFANVEDLKPIKPTAKILLANGFEYDELDEEYSFEIPARDGFGCVADIQRLHDDEFYKAWVGEFFGPNGEIDEFRFKYVHQMQHMMRLLGFKKEIEL